jgi:hypothetical protein
MCRYAESGPYKEKFACFECRKMFKQTSRWELRHQMRVDSTGKRLAKCPECGNLMHNMGLDFHAPRQSDIKQWRKVAILHAHGIDFSSCGCGGPGERPATLRDVPAFLEKIVLEQQHREQKRVKQLLGKTEKPRRKK